MPNLLLSTRFRSAGAILSSRFMRLIDRYQITQYTVRAGFVFDTNSIWGGPFAQLMLLGLTMRNDDSNVVDLIMGEISRAYNDCPQKVFATLTEARLDSEVFPSAVSSRSSCQTERKTM
jgi:hypothetical protein